MSKYLEEEQLIKYYKDNEFKQFIKLQEEKKEKLLNKKIDYVIELLTQINELLTER